MSDELTLADLAEAADLPARTVRFYIARGLLSGPVKGGRAAVYTRAHLSRLSEIKRLQASGRTLREIAAEAEGTPPREAPQPSPWWQHVIADDIVVWVRADASPWRTKQVRAALADFSARLRYSDRKESEDS